MRPANNSVLGVVNLVGDCVGRLELSLPNWGSWGMVPVPRALTGPEDTNQDGPVVTTNITREGFP